MPIGDTEFQAAANKDRVVDALDNALTLFPTETIPSTVSIKEHAALVAALQSQQFAWPVDERIEEEMGIVFQSFYVDLRTALTTLKGTVEAEKIDILNPVEP